jgi:hypothetical protein
MYTKKAKNCEVGYSCGLTCISVYKVCWKEFPEGLSVTLDNHLAVYALPQRDVGKAADVLYKKIEELTNYNNFFKPKWSNLVDEIVTLEFDLKRKKSLMARKEKEIRSDLGLNRFGKLQGEDQQRVDKALGENSKYQEFKKSYEDVKERIDGLKEKKRQAAREVEEKIKNLPEYKDAEVREAAAIRRAWERYGTDKNQAKKIEAMVQNTKLTREEALAVAAWISIDDYSDLNKILYDKYDIVPRDYGALEYVNKVLPRALAKLPKADRDDMIELYADREGLDYDEAEADMLPPGRFERGLKMDDPATFVRRYERQMGDIIEEQTNFAATNLGGTEFVENANVIYRIRANDMGEGNGVALDAYKNYAFEGEIFWAAGQKFKVLGTSQSDTDDKFFIDLEEVVV